MNTLAATRIGLTQRVKQREHIASVLAQLAVASLLFVSMTAPVINISDALPWFRAEQLLLIPIVLVYAWLLLTGRARTFRINVLFTVGIAYSCCILISLLYGKFVLGHELLYRDLYEFPKIWLAVAFFTIGLEVRLSEASIRRVFFVFSLAIIPVCLYAWAQWMDLGVAHWLVRFYSGGWHDEGALAHYRRVYSTMGNPNLLGQLLTWAIAAFTVALMNRIGSRFFNVILVLACLITLAMTGSRYGLLDTGLVFLLVLLLSLAVKHSRPRPLLSLALLIPVFVWVTFSTARTNPATLDRVRSLRDPLATDSLSGRLGDLWPDASKDFFASPVVGQGPAKEIYSDIFTDSEYLDVLKQFGVLGFIAYFAFYVFPLRRIWHGLKFRARSRLPVDVLLPAASSSLQLSFIMLVTGLVMNVGMSVFYNVPLQGFFWLWIGIGVASARNISVNLRAPNRDWGTPRSLAHCDERKGLDYLA